MEKEYAASLKLCATCAYWLGQRDINIYGTMVLKCREEGRCAVPHGPIRITPANKCACFDWKKWTVLK